MNRRHGFTLIELLFVVGIIAVLAAITVPNFLEAQVRSKIARTRADLSVISLGLGRYYADHGAYPPNHPEVMTYLNTAVENPIMDEQAVAPPLTAKIFWHETNEPGGGGLWGSGAVDDNAAYGHTEFPPLYYNARQLNLLTTPVAYLESGIPVDVFSSRRVLRPAYLNSYDLFANDTRTTHPGLWGQHVTSETLVVTVSKGPDNELNIIHPVNGPWIAYDPTNGTVSDGDIIHTEGDSLNYEKPKLEHLPERLKNDYGIDPAMMGFL